MSMQFINAKKNISSQRVLNKLFSSVLDSSAQSESLQRKADMANNAAQRAEAPRPNNTGMPDNLKAGIESLSGFSMDDVRVHYNSSKPATVQALAYTQGTDIHVAPGQEKHLPHEAWHVAQQMAGRVSPTTNINGMPVNDNADLEHEADVMGEKAVAQRKNEKRIEKKSVRGENDVLQRVKIIVDEITENDFHNKITEALGMISDEWVVKGVKDAAYLDNTMNPDPQQSKHNWGDVFITSGDKSEFCAGEIDDSQRLKLNMNIKQCEELYFGNDDDIDRIVTDPDFLPENLEGNVGVASTLLHELGHAYQHYLKIKNQKEKQYVELEEYPLLREKLLNLSEFEANKYFMMLNQMYPIGDKQRVELLLEHVNKICSNGMSGSVNDSLEADNLFVNEIPYNSRHEYNGKPMGVRTKYDKALTPEGVENKRDYMMIYGFMRWTSYKKFTNILKKSEYFKLSECQKMEATNLFFNRKAGDMYNAIDRLSESDLIRIMAICLSNSDFLNEGEKKQYKEISKDSEKVKYWYEIYMKRFWVEG